MSDGKTDTGNAPKKTKIRRATHERAKGSAGKRIAQQHQNGLAGAAGEGITKISPYLTKTPKWNTDILKKGEVGYIFSRIQHRGEEDNGLLLKHEDKPALALLRSYAPGHNLKEIILRNLSGDEGDQLNEGPDDEIFNPMKNIFTRPDKPDTPDNPVNYLGEALIDEDRGLDAGAMSKYQEYLKKISKQIYGINTQNSIGFMITYLDKKRIIIIHDSYKRSDTLSLIHVHVSWNEQRGIPNRFAIHEDIRFIDPENEAGSGSGSDLGTGQLAKEYFEDDQLDEFIVDLPGLIAPSAPADINKSIFNPLDFIGKLPSFTIERTDYQVGYIYRADKTPVKSWRILYNLDKTEIMGEISISSRGLEGDQAVAEVRWCKSDDG